MISFTEPVYITSPLFPDLDHFQSKLQEIWDSKWLANCGHQHELLEDKLKEVLNVPFISLFNNGTIALIVAIQSLRLSGEVITTPFSFAATPHVLSWNGIKPIFCDIDPVTMNIDANKIESMITADTTAILATHIYGTPCDIKKIQQVADCYGLKVIYDAAHAFGVKLNGVDIGTFGDISMFSFHATKLFHTAEGGALTYNDPNLKTRIDLLKNFGIKNEEEVMMPGINGKMNEIQAALGLVMLEYVEEERRKRQQIIDTYHNCLRDVEGIILPEEMQGVENRQQYFVIRIKEDAFGVSRDEVYSKFKEYNVFARKYFYPLCSNYPCYHQITSASVENLPVANSIAQEVLCLPLHGRLELDSVNRICEKLKSFKGTPSTIMASRIAKIAERILQRTEEKVAASI